MSTSSEVPPRLRAVQRHLRGVRKAVLWTFVAFGVGASLTWWFRTEIMWWLLAPARDNLSETWQPIFTGPTEMLSLTIHLALLGGAIAALPVLVCNAFWLLRPLLNRQQKRLVLLFLPLGFASYLTGMAFAYWVLLPAGLGFLFQFGTDVAAPMIRITEYFDLALAMIFWLGVVFELPIAMLLLTKLGVVSYRRFKSLRRYVPPTAIILAAIITPTFDAVNLFLVAVPMIALYEVGLLLSRLVRPKLDSRASSVTL